MNCKQGDLAIIIKSLEGKSVGRIVRCVNFRAELGMKYRGGVIQGVWETDADLPVNGGGVHCYMPDEWMRPIRDNDGEDEMLRIAGKPRAECLPGYHSERAEP